MNCLNCGQETKNVKYCCTSCAAKVNNRLTVKRKPEGKCSTCETPIKTSWKQCLECRHDKTKTIKLNATTKRVSKDNPNGLVCSICSIVKTDENAFKLKDGRWQSYCKQCNAVMTAIRSRAFKTLCLQYKGGCCEKCGYDKCPASLNFHHKDPNQKSFSISQRKSKKLDEEVKRELDLCSLLCANCHYEEHYTAYSEHHKLVLDYVNKVPTQGIAP